MNGIKKFEKKKKVACDTGEMGTASGLGERGSYTNIYGLEGRREGGTIPAGRGAAPAASRGVSGTKLSEDYRLGISER